MKASLLLILATSNMVLPFTMTAQSPVLLRTFTNPTPEAGDYFGTSLAALGSGHLLVGVPYDGPTNAGAVYLFHSNGSLLTTFTNPSPEATPWYNNPESDADKFGLAIAGIGDDRVLIGAPREGMDDTGVAYVFRTNGTLLATFHNPDQTQDYAKFGFSVAALGSDRVIVGAPNVGAAYLFRDNGTLLTAFTNPVPTTAGNYFGYCVAAVGSDRVFVGAPPTILLPTNDGAAYLFNTNGTLLTTFTNPAPAIYDSFAEHVAVLGNDRLVISSKGDDFGATNSGAAYVFSAKVHC